MKSIGLYSPYIPKHSGGGERYLLSIAEACSQSGHDTYLLVPPRAVEKTRSALHTYQKTFGLDLSLVRVRATKLGSAKARLTALHETSEFDVLFAMTDGSFFPTLAKKSHLIIQIPWTRRLSLMERLKLPMWSSIIVYSEFVKGVLTNSWKTRNIRVIAPYVDIDDFKPGKKEKLILNTGRFFAHAQANSKRQDVLVDAFMQCVDAYHMKGWQLILVGNVDPNPDSYAFIQKLKELSRGYPVSIHTNLSYDSLRAYYARASIYWHAAGYGVDEREAPENTEHFGITTLEAMASGAVPFVVAKGGQSEIVQHERFFWDTTEQLAKKTHEFTQFAPEVKRDLRTKVHKRATQYSKQLFREKLLRIL